MSGPDARRVDSDGDAIVLERAKDVVDEVTKNIEVRAERHLRRAERMSKLLVELVDAFVSWKGATLDPNTVTGARAARELRHAEPLASIATMVAPAFDWILKTYGPALRDVLGPKGDTVVDSLHEFVQWVPAYRDALRAKAKAFDAEFEESVTKDADRQNQIAKDWSTVDDDGLK